MPVKTTVTGVVQGPSGDLATSGYVEFRLVPGAASQPYRVAGTVIIAPMRVRAVINASGLIKATNGTSPLEIWGNDTLQPANSTYQIIFAPAGSPRQTINGYLISGSTYDLSSPVFQTDYALNPASTPLRGEQIEGNILPLIPGVFSVGSQELPYASGYFGELFADTLNFTQPYNFLHGISVTGSVGPGHARSDAQIEIDNLAGGHVMFSFRNYDRTEEAAISYQGFLSDNSETQQAASFVRFVNDINTVGLWKSSYSIHLVGHGEDNTPFMLFSNNSIKLLAGATSGLPWNTAADANVLDVSGTGHFRAIASVGTPTSGKAVNVFYKINAGDDSGYIQAFDYDTATFKPLTINASLARVGATDNIAQVPPDGTGVEIYYRTDGAKDEGQINAYDRTANVFKFLGIGAALTRFDGTPDITAALPTTGVGLEVYYRTDGSHDEASIQAYNRATASFKPIFVGASYVDFTSYSRFVAGAYSGPTTGKGLEISYDTSPNSGFIQSYNRDTSSYEELSIESNVLNLRGVTSHVEISTLGRFVSGTPAPPAAGTGVEISYASAGARGLIVSYDRSGSVYKNLFIDGLTLVLNGFSTGGIQWGKPLVALGGGVAPTLGTIGGSGPTTAAQFKWRETLAEDGLPDWTPVWR